MLTAFATLASNNEPLLDNTASDEYYLVWVDINGNEQWEQMSMVPTTGHYKAICDFIVGVTGSRVHIYFCVNGVKYGAPAKDTPIILGYTLGNPLVPYDPSSGNELYYYTTDAGYSCSIELIQVPNLDPDGIYLSCAAVAPVGMQTELGDLDLDSRVTIADAALLIDYLLSNNLSYYVDKYNADLDQDGDITVSDVALLIDKLLGAEQPDSHMTGY